MKSGFTFEPVYVVGIAGVEEIKPTGAGFAYDTQVFGQWKVTGKESKERLIALLDEIGERKEVE